MAVDGISRYALHVVHDWFNACDCLHLLLRYNWSASLNWAFNSVNKVLIQTKPSLSGLLVILTT